VGQWLRAHGEAVYGARPLARHEWGYAVRNAAGQLYLHVLNWPGTSLDVPLPQGRSARLLASGSPVAARREGGRLVLSLPPVAPDPADTVIAIE